MQLVAYGAQDIYLTGNPQITFFKVVYRRHTNFSMEDIQQTFKGTAGNNARIVATISRNGDLVHECYLKVAAKGTNLVNPGHNIINNVECEIGGQLIDRQYGHWMETHAELTEPKGISQNVVLVDPRIGADSDLSASGVPSAFQLTAMAGGVQCAQPPPTVYVPLRFWFNRHVGLSLPLIALQYHEVNINLTLTGIYDTFSNSIQLWANYIYLDTDERRRFAQVSHEYLIEQVQFQEFNVADSATTSTFKLNFNHPVKELVWTNQLSSDLWGSASLGGAIGTGGNGFYFAGTDAILKLNGHDRFAVQTIDYFTRYQLMKYHPNGVGKGLTLDNIAVYSFALKPEEHQPSGTCNFSRIDSSQLIFNYGSAISGPVVVYVYAVNYNVLRIMSGMGGLAYSN